MSSDWQNKLYYGDNLDIMRRYIADETVDLAYLDPPFNSNANYNVLFAEKDGTKAASQIRAFEDTWTWDNEDEQVYADLVAAGGKVSDCLQAFRTLLGPCDMLAYLVMMAPRLVELRRVLKPTGSIYLHCDPTASHYLKLVMDAVFGPGNFRNEIVWKRSHAHSDAKQGATHFGRVTDTILFYGKSDEGIWNAQYLPYDEGYVDRDYRRTDPDGRRYRLSDLSGPGGAAKGNPHYEVMGIMGYWRYSQDKMNDLIRQGRIVQTRPGAVPQFKRYLDEMPGVPVQNLWNDIAVINNRAREFLGYPTQKPVALLERIVKASSNPGDVVLDIFCGCGTTIEAAQKLGRRWIGVDITHLAITLMKQRLRDAFAIEPMYRAAKPVEPNAAELQAAEGSPAYGTYRVIGEPVSVPDAADLAASDPYQFQWWALGLVGARPVEQKKGSDKGIDGKLLFQGDAPGKFETVILSVKAGHVTASQVRDLKGVLDRDKAVIGVLISMEEPTKPMREEAATGGLFTSETWGKKYPRIQLLTVAQLVEGKQIDMPPIKHVGATFKKAAKVVKGDGAQQPDLL